tara:strand:- start:2995 stop:3123 length:129 start_codon:yes stop_codon:yes gene_type:complete
MKNKYFLSLFITICIICIVGLYLIDIPAPSAIVFEEYNLKLK